MLVGTMPVGTQREVPLLLRFLSKLVLDILPAAFASVIGTFLFAQYHVGRVAEMQPAVEQAAPASGEMMQLLRDEHALIVDVLKAQVAAEKTRLAAERAASARAVAEAAQEAQAAQAAKAVAATRRVADAAAAKPAASRARAQAAKPAEPAHAPLVIARQVETTETPAPEVQEPNFIRAKTAELADNVVAGTRKVTAAIIAIPSWIVSLGERLGRPPASNPEGRFASAS